MEYVMSKKLIIIIISVVVIIAVVAIMMISSTYPENEEQIAAGSIGKVEKHHVANIQGYDIELRSDFISDDSQIKKLVRDLTYYYVTMNRLSFVLGSINYADFCGKATR
jgi:flagellar basal body-associated protein FliL